MISLPTLAELSIAEEGRDDRRPRLLLFFEETRMEELPLRSTLEASATVVARLVEVRRGVITGMVVGGGAFQFRSNEQDE